MQTNTLNTLEIAPPRKAEYAIIWLHGLGADGYDFAPIAEELGLTKPVRFIFPHAPTRPVTINGGYHMPAWYDIRTPDLTRDQDDAGIRQSQSAIEQLIKKENERGIETRRILLAGFSQGGAIALHTGLRYPEALAGILSLSAYLPLPAALPLEASAANRNTPVMMAHGTQDDVVPLDAADTSRERLTSLGYGVDCKTYPMAHTVCTAEIDDIREFIERTLA